MKFEQLVRFYAINDDGTVTVSVVKDNGYYDYFRCKARYGVMRALEEYEKGTEITAEFGIAYQKGVGLVLQLIGYSIN